MLAFIQYQLTSYIRSLKFIPPVVIFFVWIFILYAYNGVPILSSYASSSIALYVITAWITMSIFTLEEDSEKHILMSYLNRKVHYMYGKWLSILIVMKPLLLLAIFYPIVLDSFKEIMTVTLYLFVFYIHLAFIAFGMIVGTLFSATTFATKKYTWLSAVFVIVVSLAAKSIIEISSLFQWVLWIFPPVFKIANYMEGDDVILLNTPLLIDTIFVIAYILIGLRILAFLFKKKER